MTLNVHNKDSGHPSFTMDVLNLCYVMIVSIFNICRHYLNLSSCPIFIASVFSRPLSFLNDVADIP